MKDLIVLWKNPKYNALLKLILWAIFILIVYSLIIVTNNKTIKNNDKESINEQNYTKILNLSFNTLSVKYNLNDYYVEGTVQNNIFTGYIKYNDGTIYNIKYDGNIITKITDTDEKPDEYLVISINSQYLLPSYLVELFKKNKPQMIEKDLYSYKIDNIEYQVKYNDKEIYEINIIENGNLSKLEYVVIN